MKTIFVFKLIFAIIFSLICGGNASNSAISSLENSLAGTIGAIIGGVITSLAFVFAVISVLIKTNSNNEGLIKHYKFLTNTLKADANLLIWTLASAIGLPFFRKLDLPFITYPTFASTIFTKNQVITSIEIFIIIISISVLFEICECMFLCINLDEKLS